MARDGASRVLADSIEGEPIGKVNFVLRDSKDRVWITVSTRVKNWMRALRTDLRDGYIARYEGGIFRIVADGFQFTNEIRFDAKEEWLYVAETTGGRITRLRIDEKGGVRERETFGPTSLGKGAWPDGIAFDSHGNLWGTLVYSDKLFVLTPKGDLRCRWTRGTRRRSPRREAFFGTT
jgi:sugar lactone lactonase YvrE